MMKPVWTILVLASALVPGCAKEQEKCPSVMVTEQQVRDCIGDEKFEAQQAEERKAMESARIAEANEQASWYGSTGLPEEIERGVAPYVRLEFGELAGEPGALKAGDLKYEGSYVEGESTFHYWLIPGQRSDLYAYVEVSPGKMGATGLGGRKPPDK